jgi:acyl carrier protein
MTEQGAIAAALKSILTEEMELGLDASAFDTATPLLEKGLDLDSIVIVELITSAEDRLGFEFADSDLREANFQDLETLAAAIERRLNG